MTTTPDIDIIAGEDTVIRVTVVDQDGVAKNCTGSTISFRLGDTRANTNEFTKAGTVVDGPTGVIEVDLLNTETVLFGIRTWNYQFIVTDGEGDIQAVKEGIARIRQMIPTS